MKNYPHLILDYSKQPPLMTCKHCGATRELHLPAPMDDVAEQSKAFISTHKSCKPMEKEK